jgi:hypothetical protein
VVRLRQIVWTLVFLADRGEDRPRSCALLAAVVVVLGIAVVAVLAAPVLREWMR